jgi:CheY-like chemotaxis protein
MQGSRARILLIDDEQVILRALSRQLSDRHDVVCMLDAGMALAALANGESFDLILCDMQMPGSVAWISTGRLNITILRWPRGSSFSPPEQLPRMQAPC